MLPVKLKLAHLLYLVPAMLLLTLLVHPSQKAEAYSHTDGTCSAYPKTGFTYQNGNAYRVIALELNGDGWAVDSEYSCSGIVDGSILNGPAGYGRANEITWGPQTWDGYAWDPGRSCVGTPPNQPGIRQCSDLRNPDGSAIDGWSRNDNYWEIFQDDAAAVAIRGNVIYCNGEESVCPGPDNIFRGGSEPSAFTARGAGFQNIDPVIENGIMNMANGEVQDFDFQLWTMNSWSNVNVVVALFSLRYPPDACPNIAGAQNGVPGGMFVDGAGNCVTDECDNIPGNQASVPPNYIKVGGGCYIPPSIDLTVNGSNNPAPIFTGGGISINWNGGGDITNCSASGNWSGGKPASGSEGGDSSSAGIKTYTITCNGPAGSDTDTVSITVNNPPTCTSYSSSISDPQPGEQFTVTVGFRNNNVNAPMSNSTYVMRLTITGNTTGPNYNNSVVSYSPEPVPAGGTGSFTTQNITYPVAGAFTVTWSLQGPGVSLSCPPSGGSILVGRKPYFRGYSGDIRAGVDYGVSCTGSGTGEIRAYNNGAAGLYSGAGNQIGVFAKGAIDQFISGSLRPNPVPPSLLTFANSGGNYGGNFGASGCLPDYFAGVEDGPPLPGCNIQNWASDVYHATGASVNLCGGAIPNGRKITLYADGDVSISGSITFSGNYASPADIPSLYIVTRGNINIQNSVTQLDGIYIAQQGKIFTCTSNAGNVPDATWVSNNCATKLVVNGALIANQVKLLRTSGTLSAAPAIIPGSPGVPAGPPTGGTPSKPNFAMYWTSAWPPAAGTPGGGCILINEPADPNTWGDNALCIYREQTYGANDYSPLTDVWWRYDSYPGDPTCPNQVSWNEQSDPDMWADNYLCSNTNYGFAFNIYGITNGMYCIGVDESAEPPSHEWGNNVFCAPAGSPGSPGTPSTPAIPPTSPSANPEGIASSNIAEVINFDPEFWLAGPINGPSGELQFFPDAIVNLPPVL